MNRSDSDNRVCEQCGAPLGYHTREGLCTRCIARFTLLESEDNAQKAEDGSRRSEGGDRNSGSPSVTSVASCSDPARFAQAVTEVTEGDTPTASDALNGSQGSTGVQPARRSRFGDYELIEEIAHGGMGVVYRARQVSLKRVVAVKMLLFGQFAGKAAFDRFRAEAQTAAHLQHPNIVAVHEIGETDGQPYFSMDFVAGRNLAELVRDRPMPARQAAGYLRKIAQAVHYAHVHGVLHRDLKPANVLIDEADEPRITDFGLARQLAGDSGLTLTGQVLGSPNFMPPEQGTGKRAKVGPVSDIYGLGALLYYLLTARPPFLAETFEATLAQVLNTDPVAPRQLNPSIPRDLETLCLKCLEKDPARRYASAAELADELDRFLRDEPIRARSIGPAGKAWRWCRRKPVLAGMTAAVVTLLLTVTAVSVTAARRAKAQARELRLNLYVADMNVAYQAVVDNNLGLASELIRKYLPETQRAQDGAVNQAAGDQIEDPRGWEWRYLWGRCQGDSLWTFRGHTNFCSCAVFSPDGKTLVTASFDQTVRIWDVAKKSALQRLTGFAGPIQRNSVTLSPDGATLAVADGADIHLFETTRWTRIRTLVNPASSGRLCSVPIAFSPDGRNLACNADGELRQWDTTTWEQRNDQIPPRVGEFGCLLAYSADGRHIATATSDGILVGDTSSDKPGSSFFRPLLWPASVVFSPDAKSVAAVGIEGAAVVWDADDGREIVRLAAHPMLALAVAFSPDGRRLVTGGADQVIRLWEIEPGRLLASWKGHHNEIWALAFSPDGQTLASGSKDGTARVWTVKQEITAGGLRAGGKPLHFSADGNTLALLSTNSTVEYWNVRSGSLVRSFTIPDGLGQIDRRVAVSTSPDGQLLAVVGTNGIARAWDLSSQELIAEAMLDPPPRWPRAAFSPDNHLLAISCGPRNSGGGGWTVIWDFRTGLRRKLPGEDVYAPNFSPAGGILATGAGSDVQLWTLPDLKPLASLKSHQWDVNSLAFSPYDGSLLASAGRDNSIRLWDVATCRLRAILSGHQSGSALEATAFSPDGKTLASGERSVVKLWHVATGKLLFTIKGMNLNFGSALFSPDGNALLVGGSVFSAALSPVELLLAPSLSEIQVAENLQHESP